MTSVACSVYDRIGKGNLYFGAESAGSLTPLTTLSPDVTASDPSLGNSTDAAYCVGLTPTEQRELQSSWALTTRAALRRYAPSARAVNKRSSRHSAGRTSVLFQLMGNRQSGPVFMHKKQPDRHPAGLQYTLIRNLKSVLKDNFMGKSHKEG